MRDLLFSIFFFFLSLALQRSNCATVVVDEFSQWNNPTASVGDTIIFKHKNEYNLFIFRTRDAFNACNFTLATPLSNPNSNSYTWHPSRPGNFYFSFYNGTSEPCEEDQKVAVQITPFSSPANPPEVQPPVTSGGFVSSSPAYPWPFQPREKDGSTGEISPAPPVSPMSGGSIPFINSNPAVPLPSGEVDSATIKPLPSAANHAPMGLKMVGLIKGLMSLCCVIVVMQ